MMWIVAFVGFLVVASISEHNALLSTSHIQQVSALRRSAIQRLNGMNADSVMTEEYKQKNSKKRAVIVGATGYIGKYVTKEAIRRGYDTVAVVREASTPNEDYLKGSTVVRADVTNVEELKSKVFDKKADIVISCLASRSGKNENR